MTRPSYRAAVRWIAGNDEPEDLDPESVAEYISTSLVADLFGKDPLDVGTAIVAVRLREAAEL